MKILVSACLMGRLCKYNAGHNFRQAVADLAQKHELVEVCPEVMGGRTIPRKCIEIRNGRFIEADGTDVDAEVRDGVCQALEIAKMSFIPKTAKAILSFILPSYRPSARWR